MFILFSIKVISIYLPETVILKCGRIRSSKKICHLIFIDAKINKNFFTKVFVRNVSTLL